MLMIDREYTHGVPHALKGMGLKLSADQFGTDEVTSFPHRMQMH